MTSLLNANNNGGIRSNNAAFNSMDTFTVNDTRHQSINDDHTPANNRGGAAVMAGALDVSENQMSTSHFNEGDTVRTVLSRGSWGSSRIPEDSTTEGILYVILGAFSEKAMQKIFPCLLRLYETALIDQRGSSFVAMGLEECDNDLYRQYCGECLPPSSKRKDFINRICYYRG